VAAFIQHCILPRVLTSGIDALYCAKFVELMIGYPSCSVMLRVATHVHNSKQDHNAHPTPTELRAPYFSVIHYLDQLCKLLPCLLKSLSSFEATRFGRHQHPNKLSTLDTLSI
jgi:hypothetical protein